MEGSGGQLWTWGALWGRPRLQVGAYNADFPKVIRKDMFCLNGKVGLKKSCIRETLNLSTNADSSTDTTVGLTKNTQKPKKKIKTEKLIQNGKTQKRLEICKN